MGNYCMKPVEEKETLNKEIEEIKYYDKQGKAIPKEEWEKNWSKNNIMLKETKENINHPDHYISNGMEVIDIIEKFDLNFHLGNAIKYILRARKKHDNVEEDIKKAIWYLNRFIK